MQTRRSAAARLTQTRIYHRLYGLYKRLYFGFGRRGSAAIAAGDVLPELRAIAAEVRN